MVLAEKKIAAELVDVDAKALPERVREVNPYETVPTLVDRDLVLYESQIIMSFLDERYPHPPLMPVDPVTRARARLYMYRIDRDWYGLMTRIKGGDDQARVELHDSLVSSAPLFAASRFFLSDELTLVDFVLAPLLWRCPVLGCCCRRRGGPSAPMPRASSTPRPFNKVCRSRKRPCQVCNGVRLARL
jgi:RNA polymerase-associated protein